MNSSFDKQHPIYMVEKCQLLSVGPQYQIRGLRFKLQNHVEHFNLNNYNNRLDLTSVQVCATFWYHFVL